MNPAKRIPKQEFYACHPSRQEIDRKKIELEKESRVPVYFIAQQWKWGGGRL
jgi:hypothetical protein